MGSISDYFVVGAVSNLNEDCYLGNDIASVGTEHVISAVTRAQAARCSLDTFFEERQNTKNIEEVNEEIHPPNTSQTPNTPVLSDTCWDSMTGDAGGPVPFSKNRQMTDKLKP